MGVVQSQLRNALGVTGLNPWNATPMTARKNMFNTNTAVKSVQDQVPYYPVIATWICHHCGCGNTDDHSKCVSCEVKRKPVTNDD